MSVIPKYLPPGIDYQKMSKEHKADAALCLVALSWGASNYAITICLDELGPMTTNLFRFLTAFITVVIFGIGKLKNMNMTTFKYAAVMGVFLTGNYYFCNTSLMYTTISNAGFFCGLACLFVPFGEWIFFKKKPHAKIWIAISIAFIGVFLMSMKGDFSFNGETLKGDILALCTSLSYTGNLLVIEKAVEDERTDAYNLGSMQIGFTWLFCTIIAFIIETPVLPHNPATIWCLLFLGVLCTGVAFVAEPVAQQYTTATKVALIFTLEPVFCAIIAFLFNDEILFAQNYIGMLLLLSSIILLEIDWSTALKKKK